MQNQLTKSKKTLHFFYTFPEKHWKSAGFLSFWELILHICCVLQAKINFFMKSLIFFFFLRNFLRWMGGVWAAVPAWLQPARAPEPASQPASHPGSQPTSQHTSQPVTYSARQLASQLAIQGASQPASTVTKKKLYMHHCNIQSRITTQPSVSRFSYLIQFVG